jgi:hemolysin activation/secretion protein
LLPLGNESGDNLMIQGSHQESDIATLGITPTIGRGNSAGIRYIHTLPLPFVPASPPPQPEGSPAKLGEQNAPERFHHSISAGFDYKQNYQHVTSTVLDPRGGPATTTIRETDTTSYPFMATYSLLWEKGRWRTQLNAGLTFHFRGMGSSLSDLGDSRFAADGAYALFRADLTETVILPADFRAVSIIQGQITDRPLLPSEQIAAGGLGTVRGYLEAETSGDNGAFGSIEIQSLSLIPKSWGELRLHSFCDWGWVGNNDRLSGEKDHRLYSIGGGTRLKLGRYFTGSLDLGLPLVDGPRTRHDDLHLTFRAGIDY